MSERGIDIWTQVKILVGVRLSKPSPHFKVCKRILLSYFSFKLLDGCSKFHNVDVFHNINAFLLQ